MADQEDLQKLIKLLTSRKIPVMTAMGHVKALQSEKLRSIAEIAEAPLATIEKALKDSKLAKSFHSACKSHGKSGVKRPADEAASPSPKRPNLMPHKHDVDYSSVTADELEKSMHLPVVEHENLIQATSIVTNRAPLVLAFAVELIRFTMPEQPPSSRLSLAQAVVSVNSRTKGVSLGLEKPSTGADGHIPQGQPKVRILGREVSVLKRGGYSWKAQQEGTSDTDRLEQAHPSISRAAGSQSAWTASQRLTSKGSTFIVHATYVESANQRPGLMKVLMGQKPELDTATHNAWAVRTSYGSSPLVQEASFDDGETGCGKLMLEVMREANVRNTVVVLSRWFGGILLGPDRWRLMRECVNDALSSQLRTCSDTATSLAGEAVWALDEHCDKSGSASSGLAIHRPEGARNYLLGSFASPETADQAKKKKKSEEIAEEKQENLARLLGALRILFASWAQVLGKDELDRRAWSWYVAVRPEVEAGPGGWGAKGLLSLGKILGLRRRAS